MMSPTGVCTTPPPSSAGQLSLSGSAFISIAAHLFNSSDVVVELSFAITSWPKCTSLAPKKESTCAADAGRTASAASSAAAMTPTLARGICADSP